MFRNKIIRVLSSQDARRLIDAAVRECLEDPTSTTRAGMMRIVRGEAKDAVQDANERGRELLELDAGYQEWAQARREAMVEQEAEQRRAMTVYARTGVAPELHDPLDEYPAGADVLVVDDPLFGGRTGTVKSTTQSHGFPEVHVLLESRMEPVAFTPRALRPIYRTEAAAPLQENVTAQIDRLVSCGMDRSRAIAILRDGDAPTPADASVMTKAALLVLAGGALPGEVATQQLPAVP